jgi:hypothetical protein
MILSTHKKKLIKQTENNELAALKETSFKINNGVIIKQNMMQQLMQLKMLPESKMTAQPVMKQKRC